MWAFVIVLSTSRHMLVRPVLSMALPTWIDAHIAAFHFFGGVTKRLVVDNLKAGVLKPDLYDPKTDRTYHELATHYGTLVDPARMGHPKDKPRVERPIPYIRDSFFRGRDFSSLKMMVAAAQTWSQDVAGRRACRPLCGAQPLAVFEAAEKSALLALPRRDYQLATWWTPKVAPDTLVSVDGE